jgi:hypothetical protein
VGAHGVEQRCAWASRMRTVLAVAVGLTLVLGAVSCTTDEAGAVVRLEPADVGGSDPFTSSVALGEVAKFPTKVKAAAAESRDDLPRDPATEALAAAGTAPGLYGGSGESSVCDPQQLVAFLAEQEEKARAWASVFDIEVGDIPRYVAGLTPVVLISDTVVTNHGFKDGKATELQSVLQAGTAVMVDSRGLPRVKCNCGNPLAPPSPDALSDASPAGEPWPGYEQGDVVAVAPGQPATTLTLVDVETAEPIEVPVGTTQDGWVMAQVERNPGTGAPSTAVLTSSDGRSWSAVASIPGVQVTGLAQGGDRWIAVGVTVDQRSAVYASADLASWDQVAELDGQLAALTYGDGRWVAVGAWAAGVAVGGLNHATPLVYWSDDGTDWTSVDLPTASSANMHFLPAVAFDASGFTIKGVDERDDASGLAATEYEVTTYLSADGASWQLAGHAPQLAGGNRVALAAGDDQLVLGAQVWTPPPGATGLGGPAIGAAITIDPEDAGGETVDGTPFDGTPADEIAFGAGRWLAVSNGPVGSGSEASLPPTGPAQLFESLDATTWTPLGTPDGVVGAIAYGRRAARSEPSDETTTTTEAPPTTTTTSAPPSGGTLGAEPAFSSTAASGSGCAPGPGPLPDGWWYGRATTEVVAGAAFDFDLACYYTGDIADELARADGLESAEDDYWVVNDQATLRSVAVSSSAELVCVNLGAQEEGCAAPPGMQFGIWVRVEGGTATKVLEQFAP